MPESFELAMFPLESALLPGEDLPLRIFEPRYQTMVADCMRSTEPRFGVVLISRGREVGGGDVRGDVGVLARITECVKTGAGRYALRCRTAERIRVCDWLSDDPYPRAMARLWPDEPGESVSEAQILDIEDRMMALLKRIADVEGAVLPSRDVLLGAGRADSDDAGQRLYALASRLPIGAADRYAVLSAPSAAERRAALSEALDSVAAIVEFHLSD
jgi:Lon protease-like protein